MTMGRPQTSLTPNPEARNAQTPGRPFSEPNYFSGLLDSWISAIS
jgi:hypothetical protein